MDNLHTITLTSEWDSNQWTYVYLFSDASNNKNGFGAFVPNYGVQKYEFSVAGVQDLSATEGVNGMRVGSRANGGGYAMHLLLKMVIYKGISIHQSSLNSLDDLLNSKSIQQIGIDCPRLIVTSTPACTSTLLHYRMLGDYISADTQSILDSSGLAPNGVNGHNPSDNSYDCGVSFYGIKFNSVCYLSFSSLLLGRRAFSLQVLINLQNPSLPSGAMLLRRHHPNDFYISIDAVPQELTVQIDNLSVTGACSAIQVNEWISVSVSLMSDGIYSFVQLFCEQNLIASQKIVATIQHASGSFRIGQGFYGMIKDFKVFSTALGAQTFLKQTSIPQPCSSGYYYKQDTRTCEPCSPICGTCVGPTISDCSTCANADVTKMDGTCGCEGGSFIDRINKTCLPCDPGCLTCAANASTCTSCVSSLILRSNTCFCSHGAAYDGVSCDCVEITPDGECSKCGNAQVDLNQECDDGNLIENDGCSPNCTVQPIFSCPTVNGLSHCFSLHSLSVITSTFNCEEEKSILSVYLSIPVFLQDLSLLHFTSSQEIQFTELRIPTQPSSTFEIVLNPKYPSAAHDQVLFAEFQTQMIRNLDQSTTMGLSVNFDFAPHSCPSSALITASLILTNTFSSLTTAALLSGIPAQIFLDLSLESLWALLNTDQLIFFIPLISMPLSRNSLILFKVLSFAHGDLYLIVLCFQLTLRKLIPQSVSAPFSAYFSRLGYSSSGLIDNLGPFYTLLLLFLFFLLLSQAARLSTKPNISKLATLFLFGPFLRLFLESFLEVTLFTSISIVSSTSSLEYSLALITLSTFLIICFLLLRITGTISNQFNSGSQKYKELFQRLKTNGSFLARHYFSWFIFRRFSVVILILFFGFSPLLQLSVHILLTILDLLILFILKPFSSPFDQIFSLVNSFFLLSLYFLVGTLHLFRTDPTLVDKYSLAFVIIILGFNAVCFIVILTCKVKEAVQKCKQRRVQKKRRAKYQANRTKIAVSQSITPCFEDSNYEPTKSTFFRSKIHKLEEQRRVSIRQNLESIQ